MGFESLVIMVLLSILACGIIFASTCPSETWWQRLSLNLVYCAAGAQLGAVIVHLTNLATEYFK